MSTSNPPLSVITPLSLVTAILFAIAHTQPELFYSNQNQYFLHGMAQAGFGDLASDWLANTEDPTPLFSLGVAWGYRLAGEWLFHVAFFLLLLVYFLSLWAIIGTLPFRPVTASSQTLVLGLIILVHAGIARSASVALTGVDYLWYLQAGLANQYVLGAGLQPSVFGVLLLSSIAAYARGKPVLAGILAASACLFHSTYLLHAGLLVGGMMIQQFRHKQYRSSVTTGAVALVIVIPVIVHVVWKFGGTSPDTLAAAHELIAWRRIPHHCLISRWFAGVDAAQLAWIALALVLLRRTPWLQALLWGTVAAIALTIIQYQTGSATLALLFPWRFSAILVPLATAVVITWAVSLAEVRVAPRLLLIKAIASMVVAVSGAAVVYALGLGYQTSPAERGLIDYVRLHRQPGDLYLLPTRFPKPSQSRGTSSATFVPIKLSSSAIFELQRFRLATGAAIYVDFKSIPYQDVEVLEWARRVEQVQTWFAVPNWDETAILEELRQLKVTHVILPANVQVQSEQFEPVFEDADFRLYKLASARS